MSGYLVLFMPLLWMAVSLQWIWHHLAEINRKMRP